ncbi:hypothetical protein ACQ86N_13660 [Puia sp. P3]|uniref:hypothetical protein n=1 Tax=Puia sp. P3 TaxID=3423952 RepID=UPI003D667FB1
MSRRYTLTPLDREGFSHGALLAGAEGGPVVGIIANESEPFCRDCDRLRLDSGGNIYGCLSSNHPIALGLEETDAEWEQKLQQAMEQKQLVRFTGSDLSMLRIGG